jgi:hypothetical protein
MFNSTKIFFITILGFIILVPNPKLNAQIRQEIVDGDTLLIYTHPLKDKFENSILLSIDKQDSIYQYQYQLINLHSSQQEIWYWLIFSESKISIVNTPYGWRANLKDEPKRISFSSTAQRFRVSPSDTLKSILLSSNSLPTIKKYFMEGWEQLVLQTGLEPDSIENASFFDTAKEGFMIFPRERIINDINILTDTLETFRFRSCEELDWATDTVVCGELENDLYDVKANLQAGDSLSAANALSDFIELVEQEKGESLTSEGYALLYFNAEYLAERLPEPVKEPEGSGITCECANPVTQTSGQIRFSGGETQCLSGEFSGSVFFQQAGRLEVCGNATFQNISGNNTGTVAVSETGVVSIQNWNNNNSADSLINWGSMEFRNQVNVNRGQLINHGELTVNGGLNQNNGSLTNSGTLTVNRAMNLNQPGTMNTGVLSIGQRLTLNSNASLINECRVSVNGPVQLNGTFTSESGSVLQSTGRMTINSQGVLNLNGENTMVWIDAHRLNGSIESNGSNQLLYSQNTIQTNNRAEINSASDLLQVWAPNINSLLGNYSITDGTNAVIPAGACNPDGFNN